MYVLVVTAIGKEFLLPRHRIKLRRSAVLSVCSWYLLIWFQNRVAKHFDDFFIHIPEIQRNLKDRLSPTEGIKIKHIN